MKPLQQRVWDLPVRLFHWSWVTLLVIAFVSHESDRYLDIHVFAGYAFLALLLFRVVWGFIGSQYARFRSFAFGWRQLRDYLRSPPPHYTGHNPAGAWAIFAMLGLGLVISVSGVLTLGLEEGHGPLGFLFDPARGETLKTVHAFAVYSLLALVAVHVTGVVVASRLHRENLVKAMLSGHKPATDGRGVKRHGGTAALLAGGLLAGTGGYFHGYVTDADYLPFVGPVLADNPLWREECGSCHVAYHPVLLPARSWQTLLAQQADHFGEDLLLESDALGELVYFHTRHAAETRRTEAAYKILTSLAATDTPLRITETPYWQAKHREIADSVWQEVYSRANCDACHRDAALGTYEDGAMRLPRSAKL